MRCLFAVSSWFVQRASLTVNNDLSDVTNKYYSVLYCTVVVYEKKNRSLVFSSSRKIPTLRSTVQRETRQASFPTGTVGPRVRIFLSHWTPMMDSIYLTYPYQPLVKIKKNCDAIVFLKLCHHIASRRIQDFLEVFFMFFFSI